MKILNRLLLGAVLAVAMLAPPAEAANQTPTASVQKLGFNKVLVTLTATSMATGGADTAKATPIDMDKYALKPIIDCDTGTLAYKITMWATGASGIDSLRAGLYWAQTSSGNRIEDRAIGTASVNTNGKINVKLANTAGGNLITPTTWVSNKFLRYFVPTYTNADAGTAGATVFYILIEGAP